MTQLALSSRIATTFTKSGEIDEAAFRAFLQRFIDSRIDVYLGSGGAGEGHSLTWEELRRVYEIGVSECRGKIAVYANPPEQYTVRGTVDHVKQAMECGIEVVSIYTIASRHGMRPTDGELLAYFDDVMAEIRHPIIIGLNPDVGPVPSESLIAKVCNKHHQIVGINLPSQTDAYQVNLKDRLSRDIPIYVQFGGSFNKLGLGASGLFSVEANILPKTVRSYVDLYQAKSMDQVGPVYADLKRFESYVSRWMPCAPRWLKMSMRFLKIPGGEGGVREPYRMPPEDEYAQFCKGLLALGIPEIAEQARSLEFAPS